jgi:4-amino-4-deoxy-L-arabinose transferase-like glycosyltransferase
MTEQRSARSLAWLSQHGLDLSLGILGTAMGWMSLLFPFGRDQALYYYVGREWVLRGATPYKDVLDHKTPGIYMVHGAAVALFGETMWGIRVLDMAAVLCIGLLAATFAARPFERPAPGVRGVSILSANVLLFGFLSFWDTSQSELWYSLLGVACVWAARRIDRAGWAELASGAFAGAALIMKPPAVWFVFVALFIVLARVHAQQRGGPKEMALALCRFAAGALGVLLPILGYFVLNDALAAMVEIVVRSNSIYAQQERGVGSFEEAAARLSEFFGIYRVVAPLLAFGLAAGSIAALVRRDRELLARHLLAVALTLAGFAALAMQLKFYLLHYVALFAPAVVICALLADDCRLLFARLRGHQVAPLAFAAALVLAWSRTQGFDFYVAENRVSADYLTGEISRRKFTRFFQIPQLGFFYEHNELAGRYIGERTTPEDTIAVRGFEPVIYAVANRRYAGRFFWTTFLVSPTRGDDEMRRRWNEEDRATLDQHPPRFAVALMGREGQDSAAWFLSRGYEQRETFGEYIVLERGGDARSQAR